jgi:hypothetical protein
MLSATVEEERRCDSSNPKEPQGEGCCAWRGGGGFESWFECGGRIVVRSAASAVKCGDRSAGARSFFKNKTIYSKLALKQRKIRRKINNHIFH